MSDGAPEITWNGPSGVKANTVAGNTPTTYYVDSKNPNPKCAQDFAKIEKEGGTDNTSWMADNCDLLWIPPVDATGKQFQEQLAALKGDLSQAVEGALTKTLDAAKEKIKQEAMDLAKKKAEQAALRSGGVGRWVLQVLQPGVLAAW